MTPRLPREQGRGRAARFVDEAERNAVRTQRVAEDTVRAEIGRENARQAREQSPAPSPDRSR